MTFHRSSFTSLSTMLGVLFASAACNIFEPPPDISANGSGGRAGKENGAGGTSGTTNTESGGTMEGSDGGDSPGGAAGRGAGGTRDGGTDTDGSVGAGGKPSGGMGGGGKGGAGGGPIDAWWPHQTPVTLGTSKGTCETVGKPTENDRVASDPGATLPAPLYFGVKRFRFSAVVEETPDPNVPQITRLKPDTNAYKSLGFDMDGACTGSPTCQLDEQLVQQTKCARNSTSGAPDGNRCIDNTLGYMMGVAAADPDLGDWFGMTEADWNCEMWRGGFNNIYKVSDYNGQYNDDSVKVDLYTSTGLRDLVSNPVWSCRQKIELPLDPNWYKHAPWASTKHWFISQDSISLAADPTDNQVPDAKAEDRTAFVRGGWLVAHFPEGSELWLNGENTPIPGFREIMHRSVLAAKLVHDPGTGAWSLESATLGFVVKPDEMLQGFQQMGFCDNMCGGFNTVKGFLNQFQDTLSTDNNAPPDTKCDALSYGMTFTAAQVTVDKNDVVATKPFQICPDPKHPLAPRQGPVCRCTDTCSDGGN